MINPSCSYSCGEKRNLKGVAVSLKRFLKVLDDTQIEHDEESHIQRNLRRRPEVKTTATQFFLSARASSREMVRKNCISQSCVIVPKSDIPQELFDLTEEMEG